MEVAPQHGDHQYGNQQVRNGIHHVHDAHHERVDLATDEAGSRAPGDANRDRSHGRQHPDHERDPSSDERAYQQIASGFVGAEKMPILK